MKGSTKWRRQQFLLHSRAESQTFLSSTLASGNPAAGSGARPLFLPKAQMPVDDKNDGLYSEAGAGETASGHSFVNW